MTAAAALLAPVPLQAQLEVSFEAVDYSQLPRVTFKACVRESQLIVRGLDPSQITLLENGVPQNVTVRCPDPTEINSVVLVLDNSGSMMGAMPKLIEASKRLVDSLGANDECAVITFGRNISVIQDFTTDKARVKSMLDNMVANGGTALFDASYEGCGLLQSRAGNRHAVIITDGEDNQSVHNEDDVIAVAKQINAKLHTIAFDIDQQYQGVMQKMAVETGGVFFFVSRPSELTSVYEKIADIITEPCCIAEYVSDNCVDTLRSLLLSVTHNGSTATAVADFISPSRASMSVLTVDVPTDMTPLATDRGYIEINPVPNPDLLLTVSFLLKYDENLVDIPVLPFTLGTVTQNQVVEMLRVAPGTMRVVLRDIRPALNTTRLVGFPIQALLSDSSRYAEFSISDAEIIGCPTTFDYLTDRTLICQCYRALDIAMDTTMVISAQEAVLIPLRVLRGIETSLQLQAYVRISLPEEVEDFDIIPGTLLPGDALQWTHEGNELLLFTPNSPFPADTAGLLATLRIGPNRTANIRRFTVELIDSELWQRCCPEAGPTPSLSIVQEGLCDFLLREKAQPVKIQNAPNPFSESQGGRTLIVLEVPAGSAGRSFTLDILDGSGRLLRRLSEGSLKEGELHVPFDAADLPAGVYHAVVRSGSEVVSRSMLYMR